jgi:hypothetical protein
LQIREKSGNGSFPLAIQDATIHGSPRRMKSRTRISWADFTLNPWEGCTKVSDGCRFCYAENRNKRFSNGVNWGPGAPRRLSRSAHHDLVAIRKHLGDAFSIIPAGNINLVITGGESGNQARPMHPGWIDAIDADCQASEIRHHFKQWGTWAPATLVAIDANQANAGNITEVKAWPGGQTATMHRTPSKLAVKPIFGGKIQQPRVTFPTAP